MFFAKDGTVQGRDVYAYSSALAFNDYRTNETLTVADFIVGPDGVTSEPPAEVPLPGAVWLLLAGLGALRAAARRSRAEV